jgi:hypothetical protein
MKARAWSGFTPWSIPWEIQRETASWFSSAGNGWASLARIPEPLELVDVEGILEGATLLLAATELEGTGWGSSRKGFNCAGATRGPR